MLFLQWACKENVKLTKKIFSWTMRFYKDASFKVDDMAVAVAFWENKTGSFDVSSFCFSRSNYHSEDRHLRHQFWPRFRHWHGEWNFYCFAFICHRKTDSIPLPSLSVSWTSTSQIFQAKNHLPRQEQDHLTNHRLFTCRWASKSELFTVQ